MGKQRKGKSGICSLGTEGQKESDCTWAVENVERTYLKKYLFEH